MTNDRLFSPFSIKNVTFQNRLGVAPMTRMSSRADSVPRDDVFGFLVRRARNGAGLVYTEAIVTDYESAQGYPGQARLLTQRQIDRWRPVVREVRDAGSRMIAQIFHCGRMGWPEVNPAGRIIAPSALGPRQDNPLTGQPYPVPDEMTPFDIDHVISGFVETARGAAQVGFDGLEIHGAHGYLISQFLSSYSNRRSDDYGGSLENRFRFARRVIRAVRDAIGPEMLLTFRISNWGVADMDVPLFETSREWQDVIRLLALEPVDAISVSAYDYAEKVYETGQTYTALAREACELPLLACGKIYDRASAEGALSYADFALSGKSVLLNPDWVDDVRAGRPLPVRASDEANVAYTETPLP